MFFATHTPISPRPPHLNPSFQQNPRIPSTNVLKRTLVIVARPLVPHAVFSRCHPSSPQNPPPTFLPAELFPPPLRSLPLHERPQENRWSSLHASSFPVPSFRVTIHHCHRILRRHSSPPNFSLRPFRHLPLHGKKPSSADCCTVTAWCNGKKNATKKRSLCRDRFNKIKHVSLRVLRQPWRRVP